MAALKTEGAEELLRLKEEILERWERLPPEHQATMLLVLVDRSEWGDWAVEAHKLLGANKGGWYESRKTGDLLDPGRG
jgi:hypothetical protein